MARALIIGAGAIGRGFLPWTFEEMDFDIYDSSPDLCQQISQNGGYKSYIATEGQLKSRNFSPGACVADISKLDLSIYSIAFVAVGPRNCAALPLELTQLNCPIFSLENDPYSVNTIEQITKRKNVFFGVPDVITSSTASPDNLIEDSLSLHTEDGVLYLESNAGISDYLRKHLPKVVWGTKEEMIREWDAKLFLHNTPHCVAAYLAHLDNGTYLHDGFKNREITRVVEGVIEELILALKRTTNHDHEFLESYADKELRRFSNELLYDPISRVAREPLRKLALGGRLMGGLSMCILAGVNPAFLNIGISAALQYKNPNDNDYMKMLHLEDFGPMNFLKYFLNINPQTVESKYITESFMHTNMFLEQRIKCH